MLSDNNEIINDAPFCLCHEVLNTVKTLPQLIYNKHYNVYQMYCSKCGFKTFTDENKQAVISDWFYSNRPSDAHIKWCWVNRYNKQNGTKISLPGTRAH
jgi:hypothetical protein